MIASFLKDLSQPEYIHVLINPLPVYGLAMGIIGLIIALMQRSRPAQVATLALILLSGAIAWPVVHYGEEGYDRVLSMSDDQGQAWLKVHEHRADELAWSFYVLAGVAAAAILAPMKWPTSATVVDRPYSAAFLRRSWHRWLHRPRRRENSPSRISQRTGAARPGRAGRTLTTCASISSLSSLKSAAFR